MKFTLLTTTAAIVGVCNASSLRAQAGMPEHIKEVATEHREAPKHVPQALHKAVAEGRKVLASMSAAEVEGLKAAAVDTIEAEQIPKYSGYYMSGTNTCSAAYGSFYWTKIAPSSCKKVANTDPNSALFVRTGCTYYENNVIASYRAYLDSACKVPLTAVTQEIMGDKRCLPYKDSNGVVVSELYTKYFCEDELPMVSPTADCFSATYLSNSACAHYGSALYYDQFASYFASYLGIGCPTQLDSTVLCEAELLVDDDAMENGEAATMQVQSYFLGDLFTNNPNFTNTNYAHP